MPSVFFNCIYRHMLLSLIALGFLHGGTALAAYPDKPIKFVIPFAPGGGTDMQMRIIAPKLTELLGQQIILENRPGSGSTIGTEIVVRSQPDGYTFVVVDTAFTSNPALLTKIPYDSIKDLTAVILLTSGASALVVNPAIPAKTVNELIALAKIKNGALAYASAGAGTSSHLTGELFKLSTGIDMIHAPYKGAGPAVTDTVAGQVAATFTNISSSKAFIDSGQLRALAVTGYTRSSALPNVPTFSEVGLTAVSQASSYWGVLAPAATPRDIILKINQEMNKVLQMPEIRTRLTELGFNVVGGTPEEYSKYIRDSIVNWRRVVKDAGIKID